MAFQFVLNVIIAVVWMLLHNEFSAVQFIVGYLIGIGCIGLSRRFWLRQFYLVRVWAVLKLIALFFKELLLSSLTVIKHALRPKLAFRPGIFAFRTELQSDWEIAILSCLICLTPGTVTLDVSADGRTLYIHAIDMGDEAELSEQIKNSFEKAIREVTGA